ncbi:helix-turn-helix transcriptional regulator [Gulosibacter molinativorax]|nr:WYL domain-containing protein [Gulosibacter molinativorax]QUY61548.1 Hypotetical protein [Gulosibacter molinativorax]
MANQEKVDPVLITSILDFLRRNEHGYDLAEMADHFGLSPERLRSVIEFLWTLEFPATGLSGHEHMFDFDADGLYAAEPWVKLTHDPAAKVTRRFEPHELATVITGLSTLRQFRSSEEISTLDGLVAKLLGTDAAAEGPAPDENQTVAALRRAIDRGTQLEIDYYTENADAPERRVVDPLRLEVHGAMVYLRAYCRLREGMRWFRHDRIVAIRELDDPIGEYSEEEIGAALEVRGQSFPRLEVAVAPSAFAAVRPYLDGRDFPRLDDDGFSRCTIVFRSLHVAARIAAENAGAFVIEGPESAREFLRGWATDALENYGAVHDANA